MPPNILIITLDGARVDVIRRMPTFQRLTGTGSFFPTTITYAPYTIASQCALFTGIYGNENGVDNYYGWRLFKNNLCKTVAAYFKEKGYYTKADVFNRNVFPHQGFDDISLHNENQDDLVARHTSVIRGLRNKFSKKQKTFLYLHYSKIHASLVKNVIKRYDDFSTEYFHRQAENMREYEGYVREADAYLGSILDECSKLGVLEDTVVVLHSDHGVSVGERVGEKVYGSFCYDYTLKAFLLLLNPDFFPGRTFSQPIRTIDLTPTLLSVAGIQNTNTKFKAIRGRSVLPIIEEDEVDQRIAFSETGGLGGPYPSPRRPNVQSIRTPNWKLIYNRSTKSRELYNLERDPAEANNKSGQGEEIEPVLWRVLQRENFLRQSG